MMIMTVDIVQSVVIRTETMSETKLPGCPIPGCGGVLEHAGGMAYCVNSECIGFNLYVPTEYMQAIPRQSDALKGIVEEMEESLYKRRGVYSIAHEQEMSDWIDRLSQIADKGECGQSDVVAEVRCSIGACGGMLKESQYSKTACGGVYWRCSKCQTAYKRLENESDYDTLKAENELLDDLRAAIVDGIKTRGNLERRYPPSVVEAIDALDAFKRAQEDDHE
jgi:hypothetical protein